MLNSDASQVRIQTSNNKITLLKTEYETKMNKIIDEVKQNELNSEIEQDQERRPHTSRDKSLHKPESAKRKISTNGHK